MKPKQIGIEILSVENGWAVFDRRSADYDPGFEVPKYVFNDARQLAYAVHNLLVHGAIEPPIPPTDDETAQLLSH